MATINILIVDDSPTTISLIRLQLQKLGYRIAGTATTADNALDIMQSACPDVVLMDINLGAGMSGIEAAEIIRQRYRVPVIYVTSYSDPATLEQAKLSMPHGFINKPFRENDLRVNIEIALSRHNGNDPGTPKGIPRIRETDDYTRAHTGLSDVLDYLVAGVIIVDEELQISYKNRSATNIIEGGKLLQSRDNRLYIADPETRKQFRELVLKEQGGIATVGGGNEELYILIFPDGNPATDSLSHGRGTILFLFNKQQDAAQIEGLIRSLYSLSPTEARVASMLVFNPYLDQVAVRLGITYNTARTHLKRIYQKTGTNKLPALILKIITGPAGLVLHSREAYADHTPTRPVSSSITKS